MDELTRRLQRIQQGGIYNATLIRVGGALYVLPNHLIKEFDTLFMELSMERQRYQTAVFDKLNQLTILVAIKEYDKARERYQEFVKDFKQYRIKPIVYR